MEVAIDGQGNSISVTLDDIRTAAVQIAPHVCVTPVLRSDSLDAELGVQLLFKAEHLQEAGAFKSRGACNAVFSLDHSAAQCGVLTHSSGNHAAALSRAAQRRDIPAFIVMPKNSSPTKIELVRSFGGRITFCEPSLAAREKTAERLRQETNATFIHPYDDRRVIAGQGTATLELLESCPNLDSVIAPVGGGGLLSGTLIAAKSICPDMKVVAAEPRGADDAYRSWRAGKRILQENPQTIADGLRTSLGKLNFPIIHELVDDILLVDEEPIRETMDRLWKEMEWRVEPSGAVPLAALLRHPEKLPGDRIGVILSGGNVELSPT